MAPTSASWPTFRKASTAEDSWPASTAPASALTAVTSIAPSDGTIGSTLSLTGNESDERLDVTLVKVVDPARAANQFATPEAGNRFVAVQFRLKNTGEASYKDAPGNGAELVDGDGQHFSASLYAPTKAGPPFPGTVSVTIGDTALGYLTFELPAAAEPVTAQFSMNSGFSDDVGEWDLTRTPV
ncbi:DUF4352 domain-containing protein [Streptomyces lasiicapitis]|uniref:DUF4352 domain-containing protein n=1 Tax=Streptomyces lasiicapitis TaxID=1923961 RepID=UPI00166AA83F|nr:DUF4352 domain-containing protein [Streptomyces lasiicapitis]